MGRDHSPHIFIRDLRLQARVGVNPGEEGADQPIALDICVGVEDLRQAAASQRLQDTVDYVGVARTARRVVAARHYPLVETLATRIAETVLERPGAAWVRVRLHKLNCLRSASGAGVEIELHQQSPVQPTQVPLPDSESVVIVGGGVAGLATSLWCRRLGHPALVVDSSEQLGGQLHLVHGQMRDLPALEPMTGRQLASRLLRQFIDYGGRWARARLIQVQTPIEAACRLTLKPPGRPARTVQARAVVLAAGVSRRELGVPGEQALLGRGILPTAARDTSHLAGLRVVVVGGGDSACENALLLCAAGAQVTLVHRGDSLTARAQLRDAVGTGQITVMLNRAVVRFVGHDRLESVELQDPAGVLSAPPAEAALVRIGWVPNNAALPPHWLDARGFVRADEECHVVGEQRVFIAGDLMGRLAPSVATSIGSGAIAARATVQLLDGE